MRSLTAWMMLLACLAGIASLTMTPQPVEAVAGLEPWCLICGGSGVGDAVANIVLFAPVGIALVGTGASVWRAAGICLLLSGAIETTQWLAIPGRVASTGDLLTNTAGGALGALIAASWRTWARPSVPLARALTVGASVGWWAILIFGAWGLTPDPGRGPRSPMPSPRASPAGFGWFEGQTTHASIGAWEIAHQGGGPILVTAALPRTVALRVDASGRDHRNSLVPLLYVHASDSVARAILGQQGADAVFNVRANGSALRLLRPAVRVRGAFAQGASTAPYTITGALDGTTLDVGFARGGTARHHRLVLAPTEAWALFSPIPAIDAPNAPLATAGWIFVFACALGLWSHDAGAARGQPGAARASALWIGGAAIALGAGLAGVPRLTGYRMPTWTEWAATIGGLLCGALVAAAARDPGRGLRRPDRRRRVSGRAVAAAHRPRPVAAD